MLHLSCLGEQAEIEGGFMRGKMLQHHFWCSRLTADCVLEHRLQKGERERFPA